MYNLKLLANVCKAEETTKTVIKTTSVCNGVFADLTLTSAVASPSSAHDFPWGMKEANFLRPYDHLEVFGLFSKDHLAKWVIPWIAFDSSKNHYEERDQVDHSSSALEDR